MLHSIQLLPLTSIANEKKRNQKERLISDNRDKYFVTKNQPQNYL